MKRRTNSTADETQPSFEHLAAVGYRALLLLLPPPLRRAHASEMVSMFEERQRRLHGARSAVPGRLHLQFWWREYVGALATALRARFSPRRRRGVISAPPNPRSPRTGGLHVDSLLLDLKTAIRSLRASRASAVVAVTALALGIGANAAIFSVVYGVLQPLPYADGERFALVYEDRRGDRSSRMQLSAPEYLALEEDDSVFEELAAYRYAGALVQGDPYPESIGGTSLTHDFMDLLGSRPLHGREFTESDDADDALVVIGYELWQRRWGGDPDLVGDTIVMNDRAHEVIGITDPEFTYFNDTNRVFTLLTFTPEQAASNRTHNVLALGRLQRDVSVQEADARVVAAAEEAQQIDEHGADENRALFVYSLYDAWVGAVRQPLLLLMGAVGVLALIACANVANLEIARGLARRRELAVRLALGARTSRVVRELITESVLLAVLGGVAGLALAWLSMSALRTLIATNLPRADAIALDWRVFGFALALSVVSGVLAGLAPAWVVSRQQLTEPMKEGGLTIAGGRGAAWLRQGFLVAQVAMALVLTVGAGLLLRSVGHLRGIDLGFDAQGVAIGQLSLRLPEYRESETLLGMLTDIEQRLGQNPRIDAVGVTNLPPGSGFMITEEFLLADSSEQEPVSAVMQGADAGFFEALQIPTLRGRVLVDADVHGADVPVVLVNDVLADQYWGLDEAVGKRLRVARDESGPWMTVVGVVPAMKASPFQGDAMPAVYLPASWRTSALLGSPWLIVRGDADADNMQSLVRSVVGELDDRVPAPSFRSLDDMVGNTFARQRLNSVLLTLFAAIALLLAAVGEYAVIQYVVRQRTPEIGIRMALGAPARGVIAMVLRQGLALGVTGVAVGLAGAWAASRLIEGMLYGIEPTDALTYAATALFLVAVAAAASLWPAWRAGRVDPVIALRQQ